MKGLWGQSVRAAAIAVVGLIAVGCAAGGHAASRPVKIPTFPSTTPKTVYTPPPTALPTDCVDMLSLEDAARLVNHPLPGIAHTLIDIPNPKINRTARIDCRYGVPQESWSSGVAPLEIGAAEYTDPATAADRGKITADDSRRLDGAVVSDAQVGPDHAFVLAKPDSRELVLSKGKATLTVSIANGLMPEDKIGPALTTIAARTITFVPQ